MENEATADIVARMRDTRRRVALPFLVAAAIVAHLGLLAHVTGHWSVVGFLGDEVYYMDRMTILLSFVLPPLPVIGAGIPMYVWMRSRTRRLWENKYAARGLSSEWLAPTANRFP